MYRAALLLTTLLPLACATTPASSKKALTQAELDDGYKKTALDRAAFELPCTKTTTTLFVGEPQSAGVMTTDRAVAVSGCGPKKLYVVRCTMRTDDSITIVGQKCIALIDPTR